MLYELNPPPPLTHPQDCVLEHRFDVPHVASNLEWRVTVRCLCRGPEGTPEYWWVHRVSTVDEDGDEQFIDTPNRTIRDHAASIVRDEVELDLGWLGECEDVTDESSERYCNRLFFRFPPI